MCLLIVTECVLHTKLYSRKISCNKHIKYMAYFQVLSKETQSQRKWQGGRYSGWGKGCGIWQKLQEQQKASQETTCNLSWYVWTEVAGEGGGGEVSEEQTPWNLLAIQDVLIFFIMQWKATGDIRVISSDNFFSFVTGSCLHCPNCLELLGLGNSPNSTFWVARTIGVLPPHPSDTHF